MAVLTGRQSRMAWPVLVSLLLAMHPQRGEAQFSPGDLSRPHEHLEGTTNCATCHDVGKEISGKKCVNCHTEIAAAIRSRHGLHATAMERQTCASCHKEHLGREAPATVFRKETFDHATTGFALIGKHTAAGCEACHAARNIRDEAVLKIVRTTGRKSYLGLQTACSTCHADRHAGTLGASCQSCHDPSGWSPARGFNHRTAKFPLEGAHATVACDRCHIDMRPAKDAMRFTTKGFSDCTPCHASPHGRKFPGTACSSCHRSEGWKLIADTKFNHDVTGFRLVGSHVALRCEQCHTTGPAARPGAPRKKVSVRCEGCHADPHRGEFAGKYANDCSRCHSEQGFSPAAFTMSNHSRLKFTLGGAHAAVPCGRCHRDAAGKLSFRFDSVACESCHKDPHAGKFTGSGAARRTCEQCHSTSEWKAASFDHAMTGYPLAGKHAAVSCAHCHAGEQGKGMFRKVGKECQGCHRDAHAGQFAAEGTTLCAKCHSPEGWTKLAFDHATQSAFPLTGAHVRVACRSCHPVEHTAAGKIVRYRPLSSRCESCHTGRGFSNG